MSLPQLKQSGYTIEDWKTWDGRWELIRGVPYDMTPSPGSAHQRASMRLSVALTLGLRSAGHRHGGTPCEVFAAPIDLYLPGEESVYQPDLVVVCDLAQIVPEGLRGAPALIIEILSPGTADRDRTRKRLAYEAAGVPEYLLVDPLEQSGLLLRLEHGHYREAARVPWGGVVALLEGTVPVPLD